MCDSPCYTPPSCSKQRSCSVPSYRIVNPQPQLVYYQPPPPQYNNSFCAPQPQPQYQPQVQPLYFLPPPPPPPSSSSHNNTTSFPPATSFSVSQPNRPVSY